MRQRVRWAARISQPTEGILLSGLVTNDEKLLVTMLTLCRSEEDHASRPEVGGQLLAVGAAELVFIETESNCRHDVIPMRSIVWDENNARLMRTNRICGAKLCRYAAGQANVRCVAATSNRAAIP